MVAKKYSTDPTTKNRGGLLPDVTEGQQDKALTSAAFTGSLNKIIGPVHGQFGWYVVDVIKITPATQKSLAQETASIRTTLTTAKQEAAQTAITKQAKKAFGAKTLCASAYSMTSCHGYKAPKTSSATATSGAATTPASTGTSSATTSTTSSQ